MKKIDEILEKPNEVGSAKHYTLQGTRSTHFGSFVLLWAPIPPLDPQVVKILLFEHHDNAYK